VLVTAASVQDRDADPPSRPLTRHDISAASGKVRPGDTRV